MLEKRKLRLEEYRNYTIFSNFVNLKILYDKIFIVSPKKNDSDFIFVCENVLTMSNMLLKFS